MNTMMNDGVGKRIVDALKKQTELEFTKQINDSDGADTVVNNSAVDNSETTFNNHAQFISQPVSVQNPSLNIQSQSLGMEFNNMNNNQTMFSANNFSDVRASEMPANVMILKQLVSQLPGGVSRQAGALVIKQTMEALGISMKTVLQEAQQMQESINMSARECQNSILECKKQINTLETQVQQYQRQSASLNEIVSLFLQLN